jgi:hypothetical protein
MSAFERNTVYLDATIPSYLYDRREDLRALVEATHHWWDEERHRGTPCTFPRRRWPSWTRATTRGRTSWVNTLLNLATPEIVTPLELIREKDDAD